MDLDFKNIQVSMNQGIDTKTDPKALQAKLLALQNASFKNPGEIEKRDGFVQLPTSIEGGGNITSAIGMASFQNEILTMDGNFIYSYSPSQSNQILRGTESQQAGNLIPVFQTNTEVKSNIFSQSNPDVAYNASSGLYCYTYTQNFSDQLGLYTPNSVYYSIVDSVTGTIIVNGAQLSIAGAAPQQAYIKPMSIGNYFVIFFGQTDLVNNSKKFGYYAIPTNSPETVPSFNQITLGTLGAFGGSNFDATVINGYIYFAYTESTTQIGVNRLSSSLVLGTPFYITATIQQSASYSIAGDSSNNNVWVSWAAYNTVSGVYPVYLTVLNSSLTSETLAPVLLQNATNKVENITQIASPTATQVFWEVQNITQHQSNFLFNELIQINGTRTSPQSLVIASGIASKPFSYNGNILIFLSYDGTYEYNSSGTSLLSTSIEPTYFLVSLVSENDFNVIAKLAPNVAGGFYTSGLLPEVVSLSSSSFIMAYLQETDTISISGQITYSKSVRSSIWNFVLPYPMPKLYMGENLMLASGQLWQYDGYNVVEQGFHIYPENLFNNSIGAANTGGIGTGASTATINQMQYVAIYSWIDNQGQINRSNPSPALTINISTLQGNLTTLATVSTTQGSNVLTFVSAIASIIVGQTVTNNVVGSIPSGTIPLGSVIESIDSAGNITISNPCTGTYAGVNLVSGDVYSIQVGVPYLRFTQKTDVSLILYRTTNNGTTFYRVNNPITLGFNGGLVLNDPSQYHAIFTDTVPDAVLIGNEQLYTTGGEVGNINAPSVSSICNFKNRLCYLTPEAPLTWGYSKQVQNGVPVEFNSLEFFENIDQRIGQATAIAQLDDKLIIFGASSKFYVVGEGPTPEGTQNDFTEATKIAGTTGTNNPASVLEIPIGLLYKDSEKGIMLLDRSLQEQYIGADVEAFNSQVITSSSLIPNSHRCIFTLANGQNLVYDYFLNQWEVDIFPSYAVDSTIFENDLCYITQNGAIQQQSPGTYSDNGALIPIYLLTGPVSFAGLQGFERAKEFQLLGTWFSPHNLTINFYYDYSATPGQTVVINCQTQPSIYQFRVHLKVQKCEAVQVEIIETDSVAGQGFSLSSIAFRVGLKQGLNKLPAGASY